MKWLTDDRPRDAGLLLLRAGVGIIFIYFGVTKLQGGVELWTKLGSSLSAFGIDFWHPFWGLMAALSEFGGGLALLGGALLRPVMPFLAFTMIVAVATKFMGGDGFSGAAFPMTMLTVTVALLLTGPGRLSLDAWVAGKFARDRSAS